VVEETSKSKRINTNADLFKIFISKMPSFSFC